MGKKNKKKKGVLKQMKKARARVRAVDCGSPPPPQAKKKAKKQAKKQARKAAEACEDAVEDVVDAAEDVAKAVVAAAERTMEELQAMAKRAFKKILEAAANAMVAAAQDAGPKIQTVSTGEEVQLASYLVEGQRTVVEFTADW